MKRTPLHQIHVALGAKLVPFGGYEMPVSYPAGIAAEHRAMYPTWVNSRCQALTVTHSCNA